MSTVERIQLSAPDGRRIDVEVSGAADGPTVLFHLGTPSAGFVYPPLSELGAQRGLRHIAYSRPGYGRSERRAGRTVADCVEDVEAVTEALGIERFYTVGWSGGGPHALACTALLPERTIACATIASVAPFKADGLDFLEGMGEENHAEFGAAEAGEEPLAEYLREAREGLMAAGGAEVRASLGQLLSAVDRDAATGDFAEYLAALFHGALEAGIWGWFDDDLAFIADWGFALEAIERPVAIWQGSEDRFVPYAHGRWLAAKIPHADARLLDGDGHLSILLGAYGELLDGLLVHG
ncbi:MAG TPA: alpha/beta hydrolase [Solirubrobacteraceae bacterium]